MPVIGRRLQLAMLCKLVLSKSDFLCDSVIARRLLVKSLPPLIYHRDTKNHGAERDKLILGARAPSPAMSAKREAVTASSGLRLSVLRARAPALPALTGWLQIGSTFWAKPLRRITLK